MTILSEPPLSLGTSVEFAALRVGTVREDRIETCMGFTTSTEVAIEMDGGDRYAFVMRVA